MNTIYLEERNDEIKKANSGSIIIDRKGNVKYHFRTSKLDKILYKYLTSIEVSNWTRTFPRSLMINSGKLYWENGFSEDENGFMRDRFVLYSIITKKGSNLSIARKLISEIENIAKIKGYSEIYGVSDEFPRRVAERFGWVFVDRIKSSTCIQGEIIDSSGNLYKKVLHNF